MNRETTEAWALGSVGLFKGLLELGRQELREHKVMALSTAVGAVVAYKAMDVVLNDLISNEQ